MDTRIALGIQPLNIPDPSAPLQRALTLNALQGQSDLQGLQVQEAQRTLRQNQALDALAANSKTPEEYQSGLLKINPSMAYKLQKDRADFQKTQGDVFEQQSKQAQGLAAGFTSLKPEQYQQAFPQLRAEWLRLGLPAPNGIPEQFDPAMLPHLTMIARQGLSAKDSAERTDYAAIPSAISPTVAALSGPQPAPQPINIPAVAGPDLPGATQAPAIIKPMQPDNITATPIAQNQAPTVDVTAKGPLAPTPDDLRVQASKARALGTKAGFDTAKEMETAANMQDLRGLQEQRNQDINTRFSEREKRLSAAMDGADLRPEDAQFVARQILAGNQSAGAGLARNQKAKTMVMRAITDEAAAQGMSPQDAAAKVAEFSGIQAGQRTLGTRQANLGVAIEELKNFVPIAQSASDAVARTGFVPLNKLIQMGTSNWSPEQAQFVAANRAIINSFAQIAARGGQNVHSMVEAEHMISTAQTPEQYKAVLGQLMTEAMAAGKAPSAVRKEFSDALSGKGPGVGEAPGAPGVPSAPTKGVGDGTQANPVKIKGDDGYSMLKSGQFFIGPDGKTRQKP